jgi:hypothetical protein
MNKKIVYHIASEAGTAKATTLTEAIKIAIQTLKMEKNVTIFKKFEDQIENPQNTHQNA